MIYFIVYILETGFVDRSGTAPNMEIALLQNQIHEGVLITDYSVEYPKDVYVLDGILITRPLQLTSLNKLTINADGVDVISITNAPLGVFTAINTSTNESITGSIEGTDTFSTTIVGTYKIKIVSFPYIDFEATITAV